VCRLALVDQHDERCLVGVGLLDEPFRERLGLLRRGRQQIPPDLRGDGRGHERHAVQGAFLVGA
jgi:hypothetical protein